MAWGQVMASLGWILGLAIIVTAWSFGEAEAHKEKLPLTLVLRRRGVLRSIETGLIFFFSGLCGSLKNPWLAALSAAAAFIIFFLLIRDLLKTRPSSSKAS